jgi:hypothetical protein
MITLSYYQIAILVLIFAFSYFLYGRIKYILFFFKIKSHWKKTLKEKQDKIDKMKKEGRFHKWTTLPVSIPGEGTQETQVCEETGYCPSFDGFVDTTQIKRMLSERKTKEEFEEFKRQKIKELSDKYNMTEKTFAEIVEDTFSIKKDFHVEKMEKSIKEMKEQFGDSIKFISTVEELEKELIKEKNDPIQ